MAGVPYHYILRNLWVRKLTTLLTAGGMALVVFVFAAVLMLSEGLKATLVDTGSRDNVVIIRRGSGSSRPAGAASHRRSGAMSSSSCRRSGAGRIHP
jgi:putative ABC transport system permease protein